MILRIDWSWQGWNALSSIATIFGSIIAAIAVFLAYRTLRKTQESIENSNKIAEFEIYMKIAEKLDRKDSSEIFKACLRNDETNDSYENLEGEPIKIIFVNGKTYSLDGIELRTHILIPLDDLANFWNKNLIDIITIENGFGDYIRDVGNSTTIVNYIVYIRKFWVSKYENLERLYIVLRDRLSDEEKLNYRKNFKE